MSASHRITISYLSVGSGHQVAAHAVADALRREQEVISVNVVDPFAGLVDILPSVLERLQAASIVLTPRMYDMAWRHGTGETLFEWIADLGLLQELLLGELDDNDSDVIIATHVLPCAIGVGLKRNNNASKVFGVVTDFGLHSLWPLTGVDMYFVGHEELRNTLIYRGVDPERIFVSGIPIRLDFEQVGDFSSQPEDAELKVLVLAGGVRSGAYVDIQSCIIELLEYLRNENSDNIRMTIVTGRQEGLRKKLEKVLGPGTPNVTVLGFVENMHEFMAQHDVLISKPGGLIVAETLASGICPILLKAGPGQESANADFLARSGVAFRGETPEDIVNVLRHCVANPDRIRQMKSKARQLGMPGAARRVAKQVLSMLA